MEPGFHPFWFWNDRMEVGELRRQIREMADKGLKGFYVHPRQGLAQPYLSESFFAVMDAAIDEARKVGIAPSIYDEYPYPSGNAGGAVVLGRPELWATRLVQRRWDVAGGRVELVLPAGRVLQVVGYAAGDPGAGDQGSPIDWAHRRDLARYVGPRLQRETYVETGLTAYNRKRYFAVDPAPVLEVDLPPGGYTIFASVQVVVEDFKYWGAIGDVLDPEAVSLFIRLTHERYAERYGRLLGTVIPSLFVDETTPKLWSRRIPPAFRERFGYELCDHLDALHEPTHPAHLQVSYDLRRLTLELFEESFERPVAEWCASHGVAYAGEKPALRLSQLRHMDLPGCDPGHTKAGAPVDYLGPSPRQNARAVASAAYFYGKEGAMCECFHSMGWSGNLQDAKLVAEGLLLMGITHLVPHGVFYSTHALRKHDAPPSFFFQMPFWPFFGHLSSRVDRVLETFHDTHIDAQLAIVEPNGGMPSAEDLEAYVRVLRHLAESHIDFLMVDTDILIAGRIHADGSGRPVVRMRDVEVGIVVVPPMPIVEPELVQWLDRFRKAGGRVLHVSGPEHVTAALDYHRLVPRLSVRQGPHEAPGVYVVSRRGICRGAERRLWFLVNNRAESVDAILHSSEPLREVPLAAGDAPSLEPMDPRGTGAPRYRRVLEPFESVMLEATDEMGEDRSRQPPLIDVLVTNPVGVRSLGKNLLRMGVWRMSVLDPVGDPVRSADVAPAPLVNQLSQGRLRFAPAIRHRFGRSSEIGLPEMTVRYEATFRCEFDGEVALVMEPGSIGGEWAITLNGRYPLTAQNFHPTTAHVRGSLEADLRDGVRQGENTIRVDVRATQPDHGLCNPLYLTGDFGVVPTPPTLVAGVRVGTFEDYTANRLPYYAGAVEYESDVWIPEVPDAETVLLRLRYPCTFHEATQVTLNDGPTVPVLWTPRRACYPASSLRVGANRLLTRVFTSLIRSFEGEWFDYDIHAHRAVADGITDPNRH